MADDWLNNSEALDNVKRVLTKSGIPLETRVARICANWEGWQRIKLGDSARFEPGRGLYGDPAEETPLREVDQYISFWTHVPFTEDVDISLTLNIPIECKHREGLAVFGFPYEMRIPHTAKLSTPRSAAPPILSEFAFTDCMRALSRTVPLFGEEPLCTIGMLDQMPNKPRVADEQLIYKAGASLYDFIRHTMTPMIQPLIDSRIQDMGLIEQFSAAALKPQPWDDIWKVAYQWLRSQVTPEMYTSFNAAYASGEANPLIEVNLFAPLICVDAPLYAVEMADDGEIEKISPRPFLLSALRLPKWPGIFRPYLSPSTPEPLITVVTVDALADVLNEIAAWCQAIGQFLAVVDEREADQIPLALCFLQSVKGSLSASLNAS